MYSTGAPGNWANLRSEQYAIIICVDPSYNSAVRLPHPHGNVHWSHVMVHGVWCAISIMGARTATVTDILYPCTAVWRQVCHAWCIEYTASQVIVGTYQLGRGE